MAEQIGANRFRSALHGFNRDDVVAYIEKITQEHEKELNAVQEQNAQLLRQLNESNAALDEARQSTISPEEYEAAKRRITELLTENQSLGDRVSELEDSLAHAHEAAPEAVHVTEQDLTAPIPPVDEILPVQVAPSKDYTELELAAYRRAELAERVARERAAEVYREVASVFQSANVRMDSDQQDLVQMTRTIQGNVEQMLQVLNHIRSSYGEMEASFGAVHEKNQQLVMEQSEEKS